MLPHNVYVRILHGNTVAGKKPRFMVCACAYERSRGRSRRRPCSQSWLLRSICRLAQCLLYAFIHFIHSLYHSHSFLSLSFPLAISLSPFRHRFTNIIIIVSKIFYYRELYIYIIYNIVYLYLIYILYNCAKLCNIIII